MCPHKDLHNNVQTSILYDPIYMKYPEKTNLFLFILSSFEIMFIDFRERGGRGRERKRETLIVCLLYVPQPGIEPATQLYALTSNQIHNLWCTGYSNRKGKFKETEKRLIVA